MVQKRFADEKRSGAFGRGKVLDRVRKPVVVVENNETIQGKEKESDGVEVQPNETTTTCPAEHNAPTNLQETEKSTPTVTPLFDIESLFKYKNYYIGRDQFLTLRSGWVEKCIIDVWSFQMNKKNITRGMGEPKFIYFTTNPIIFFVVLRHDHYFIICLNFKKRVVQVIDNKTLGKGFNFVSRYENCDQILDLFLTSLRAKYAVDIIFSEMNEYSESVLNAARNIYNL
nr:uncharacterized protein LOC109150823 [Ipomoea batatas]